MSAGSFCRSPSSGMMTSPFGEIEAGHHRGGLAEVSAEVDDLDVRIARGDFVEQFLRAVGRAVVDEDEFPRAADAVERLADAGVEFGNVPRFVADRDGDGNHRGPRT